MKKLKIAFLLVLTSLLVIVGSTSAQIAYNAAFTTSITYQNVGASTANIVFSFYSENNGTAITVNRTLPAGAGSSLYVGGLNEIASGFSGSAVVSSDQPIVATLVQLSSDTQVKNRPLSNGFSQGSSQVLLATVLKNQFSTTSRFSVQNTSSTAVDVTINIFNANSPSDPAIVVTHNNLPAGAAKYFDMGTLSQITAGSFNGSATITAVEAGTATPANIVASVLEMSTSGASVSSFESIASGAPTVYMASALCQAFGADSAYAVQNVDSVAAQVTVTYDNAVTDTAVIQPGAKNSFLSCNKLSAGYSGSATITAVANGTANPANIIAIGKVFGSGNSTAFVGASSGAEKLALPYVRYSTSDFASGAKQRAFLAIQNVGAALNAGDVTVKYLDLNGTVVGTHTLGALGTGAKANSFAVHSDVVGNAADLQEFGYIGGFGGSVLIEGPSGSQLVAVVRVQSSTGSGVVGEDASGIPTN